MRRYYGVLWKLCSVLLVITIWNQEVVLTKADDGGLEKYYKHLLETGKRASDCDWAGGSLEEGWGTKKTLEYLSGVKANFPHGLGLNNLTKLRLFMARVGYLKDPGSLIFINKQTETLRLEGCGDKAIWKLKGEKELDAEFHEEGKQLKIQSPNPGSYIRKYTCINIDKKCFHTFYVITRLLPDLPHSLELRENDKMSKGQPYGLNCGLPYCNIEVCNVGKTDKIVNRRAYPPYSIYWSLRTREKNPRDEVPQGSLAKSFNLLTKDIVDWDAKNASKLMKKFHVQVYWEHMLKKTREDPEPTKNAYRNLTKDNKAWTDSFGETVVESNRNKSFTNSRIVIEQALKDQHIGIYECIIEDANGVVSTPSFFAGPRDWMEYKGRTNLFILSMGYLISVFAIAACSVALIVICIIICPKKMEYDDGTPYTKEELVSPERSGEQDAD